MRKALVLWVTLALGCTRVYTPLPAHVPTLHEAGAQEVALDAGFHGVQLRGAHVVRDGWTLRGHASGSPGGLNPYGLAGIGGARSWAQPRGEWTRIVSVGADAFGGAVPEERTWLAGASVQSDVAWNWKNATLGVAVRASYVHMDYRQAIGARARTADGLFAEPVFILRAGSAQWKAETQLGLSYPLLRRGDLGSEWPVIVSAGVTHVR